jgi:hypothetical protein
VGNSCYSTREDRNKSGSDRRLDALYEDMVGYLAMITLDIQPCLHTAQVNGQLGSIATR